MRASTFFHHKKGGCYKMVNYMSSYCWVYFHFAYIDFQNLHMQNQEFCSAYLVVKSAHLYHNPFGCESRQKMAIISQKLQRKRQVTVFLFFSIPLHCRYQFVEIIYATSTVFCAPFDGKIPVSLFRSISI